MAVDVNCPIIRNVSALGGKGYGSEGSWMGKTKSLEMGALLESIMAAIIRDQDIAWGEGLVPKPLAKIWKGSLSSKGAHGKKWSHARLRERLIKIGRGCMA